MTKYYENILKEPAELVRSLEYTLQTGRSSLEEAARILQKSEHIYIVGIGSSWNAGLAVLSFFNAAGRPAMLCDASEILHFGEIVKNATIVVLSRSGKSAEIVQLLDKVASSNVKVIAVTNTPDSPLAVRANVVLKMMASFDHAVSVSMYSVLAMVGALLAHSMREPLDDSFGVELHNSISSVAASLSPWREQIRLSDWLDVRASYYLLGRGSSLASCHEGRLLWEEAAKLPASAMSTGSFRHGSQEVVREGFRIALWIDPERMRAQDLTLAGDLRKLGARVMLIGQDLPRDAGDVVVQIPKIRREWQFLIDIMPIQIASELLALAGNQDCDTFRLCQYIVEDEGGIIHPHTRLEGVTAESLK